MSYYLNIYSALKHQPHIHQHKINLNDLSPTTTTPSHAPIRMLLFALNSITNLVFFVWIETTGNERLYTFFLFLANRLSERCLASLTTGELVGQH